ncbi:MAG: polymerase sigma factor, partial [Bacteroidota bacterium]|nr:polymerase sigma factor [Bacteroidota bacterium]
MKGMKKNYSAYNDSELVKLLYGSKAESETAFNELYHRYSAIVHAYCMKVLNDFETAEDIFQ